MSGRFPASSVPAGSAFLPPETRAGVFMGLAIDGVPPPDAGSPPRRVNTLITSVDYFRTMRTPIVWGRDFTDADAGEASPVIIVNEAFVRRFLPEGDPIGRRIGTGFDRLQPTRQVVGIVADAHDRGVGVPPYPTAYIPFTQFALPYGSDRAADGAPAGVGDSCHSRPDPAAQRVCAADRLPDIG